jgi:outer membrane protein OmpA-like peptidoglycan-associated protein
MRKKIAIITILALFSLISAWTESFRFEYEEGDKYRIRSLVNEDVYIGGRFSHHAVILNRIALSVEETENKSGFIDAEFITSERSEGTSGIFEISDSYDSRFWRDEYGEYDISPEYYMPVVRGVPTFPERSLEPGDSWSALGHEVHDFRRNFGVPEPFRFPINVRYVYRGKERYEGREYDAFDINYDVYYRPREDYPTLSLYPVRLSGTSRQVLYWDAENGRPHAYEESFEFVVTLSSGVFVEYIGTAEAKVIASENLDREKAAEDIRRRLEDGGYDAEVTESEKGVTITLEDIRFLPDSAVLIESERKKLALISDILEENYPDRDLLITGHTALAGTPEGRQILSEQRAAAVAHFFLSRGVREEEEMIIQGMGAREPVADNSTERGMRRNRRVEITILEN